jgi:serine/threonine protein kinase
VNRSYRVLARLGEGGMAIVYLALIGGSEGFRKLVALKVLREQPGIPLDELRKMFAHEARVSARCHHRNVVQILDVCELEGKPALCMEYLDGQTYRQLKAKAARTEGLPLFEQLRILAEAGHGLHHVHTLRDYNGQPLGLVHCDVSPENIFVTYDGQVKLLDFGIAQAHSERPRAPGFRGKLSYLAPELITGERIDARADVFALGAMLWEAVSVAPFSGGPAVDDATKLRARLAGSEGNIRAIRPDVPESLARIIDRSVALDPEQRFVDAEAFAFALEEYLQWAGAQPSAQSLSRLITPWFERERARLRAMVDPQLQLADRLELEAPPSSVSGVPAASADIAFPVREAQTRPPPAPTFAGAPAFAGASDTIDPGLPAPAARRRLMPVLALSAAGIFVGGLLGWGLARPPKPAPYVQPSSASAGSAAPATAAREPLPAAAAALAGAQPASPADGAVHVTADTTLKQSDLTSPPCITTARTLGEEMRRLATDIVHAESARARRHERRLRRRAAQCAAGRTEKCAPLPDTT